MTLVTLVSRNMEHTVFDKSIIVMQCEVQTDSQCSQIEERLYCILSSIAPSSHITTHHRSRINASEISTKQEQPGISEILGVFKFAKLQWLCGSWPVRRDEFLDSL